MKSNFLQRAITGIIFVAVLIGCIVGGAVSFGILFAIISALAINEFCNLVNHVEGIQVNKRICILSGIFLFLCFFYFGIDPSQTGIFIPYLALFIYLMVSELYLKKENPLNNWAYAMLSQNVHRSAICFVECIGFPLGRNSEYFTIQCYSPTIYFSFFNWVNDIGAIARDAVGQTQICCERISPKKSWEGSIGGSVFCIISSFILAHFFPFMSTGVWIGLALTVVIFGTWGDLTESLLKRRLGIKDSGNILPGHGGMLDRFDSAILAIPAAVVYLYVVSLF